MPWLNPCKLKMQTVFWKNVSKTYKKGIPNVTNINGANDPTAISAMWKTNFESLLNNVTTDAKYAKCERACSKHRIFVLWK